MFRNFLDFRDSTCDAIFASKTNFWKNVVNIRVVAISLSFMWPQESPKSDLEKGRYAQNTKIGSKNPRDNLAKTWIMIVVST